MWVEIDCFENDSECFAYLCSNKLRLVAAIIVWLSGLKIDDINVSIFWWATSVTAIFFRLRAPINSEY